MDSSQVIALYEAIGVVTDQMVAAARTGDWEQLTALESVCAGHIEHIRDGEAEPAPLSGAVRERKVKIIQKILADDREIRSIVEPWMAQLSLRINSTSVERKLSQAYGANQLG